MIFIKDRVIIIEVFFLDVYGSVNIKWVIVEISDEGIDYYIDSDYLEVRVYVCNLYINVLVCLKC